MRSPLRRGDRVEYPRKKEWGPGLVLNDDLEGKVNVYFCWAGKKLLFTQYVELLRVKKGKIRNRILDFLERELLIYNRLPAGHHNVYVIELNPVVLKNRKFQKANPQYIPAKPCVYVGLTGLTPEIRFENHQKGYKSSYFPHKYGMRLLYEEFQHYNPMPYELAALMETELASHLKKLGFGVWQN
jgi:hypothetical protein